MNYLIIAYFIIWFLIFIYTLSLGKRQNSLAKEIEIISEQLKLMESNK